MEDNSFRAATDDFSCIVVRLMSLEFSVFNLFAEAEGVEHPIIRC
jgi:hypothetical protein